jgi:hypothetical protein
MGLAETGKMENMSGSYLFPGVMCHQHPLLGRRELLQAGILGASGLCLPRLLGVAPGEPIMDLFA